MAKAKAMVNLIDRVESCKHLELKPLEKHKQSARMYLFYFTDPKERQELDESDILEYLNGLGSLAYNPFCSKTKDECVVLESPVISMQCGGDLVQSICVNWINSDRLVKCEGREYPEGSLDGKEEIIRYFLSRIKVE